MYAHTDERYDEYFGFTDTEVREMLSIMKQRIIMKKSKAGTTGISLVA